MQNDNKIPKRRNEIPNRKRIDKTASRMIYNDLFFLSVDLKIKKGKQSVKTVLTVSEV